MTGLRYMFLLLVLKNASSSPTILQPHNQLHNDVYTDMMFPSNTSPEKNDTNPLKIYKDNPFAKPFKADNRQIAKFARRLNDFHNQLTSIVLASKPGKNIIYSPLSISILSMTIAFGSRGATLKEIFRHSGLEFDVSTLGGFHQLIKIMKDIKGVDLEFANTMFASNEIDILPDYRKHITAYLDSNLQKINFRNTQLAAQKINNWCKIYTKNQITEIVTPDDLQDISLVLANAIYFKGDWMKPFDISDTENNVPFYVDQTRKVPVSMMFIENDFNWGRITELNTRFIELPYVHESYDKDSFSMFLLVPVNRDGLELVEKNLHLIDFKRLDLEEDKVRIRIPKFKIESSLDIKPVLQKMGIKSMFEHNADFRGLTRNQNIHIDKIVQKASLTVDEKGSTAAAVSAAEFADRIGVTTITADRPFICAIVLRSLGIPLFYARIVDPSTSG